MGKVILNDITSGFASKTLLNDNFTKIEASFDNTLSRDGVIPNQMEADIDLNSNDLLNISRVFSSNYYINGVLVNFSTPTNGTTNNVYEITATSATDVIYTLGFSYSPLASNIQVYINGVQQAPSSYEETSSTTITLSEPMNIDDILVVWLI